LHLIAADDLLSCAFPTIELVVARAAGVPPAIHRAGVGEASSRNPATTTYNRCLQISRTLQTDGGPTCRLAPARRSGSLGFWINQVNSDGQAIINAARSEQQGVR